MERQMDFKSDVTFAIYLKMKCLMSIGAGSEGECFKSNIDKDAYKIYFNDEMLFTGKDYDVNKIITTHEVDLNSFAFPKQLYTVNGVLKGYRTKCVEGDLFSTESTLDISNIYNINFEALYRAYLTMKNDIETLSEKQIAIYDLPFNLMFDGQKLTAIDTCGYYKTDAYVTEVFKSNLESLDLAITSIFDLWLRNEDLEPLPKGKEEDMEVYLTRLQLYLVSLRKEIKSKCY